MKSVWNIKKKYFIRTVTMALTGELVAVTPQELVLNNAAWIADTGRFASFIRGDLSSSSIEIEPFPDKKLVILGRNSIIDAVEWNYPLPREQK